MSAGTTLITGASTGIGRELARVFARHGHHLVLVARNRDRLNRLADEIKAAHGVSVTALARDLARPNAGQALFSTVRRKRILVDVLVNNAGMMENDEFAAIPLEKHLEVIQLNVIATTALSWLFANSMVECGNGRILNVGSMAGFQPLPRLAVYAATKAYILHLTEALSEELRGTGVTATALCPGFTDTDILTRAPDLQGLPSFAIGSAEQVALDGYTACMNGTPVCVSGLANQLATQVIQYQPRWLTRAIGGILARRNR